MRRGPPPPAPLLVPLGSRGTLAAAEVAALGERLKAAAAIVTDSIHGLVPAP